MLVFGLDLAESYVFGFAGSLAAELGAAVTAAANDNGVLPRKLTRPAYLVLRCVFALFAGTLAYALDAPNKVMAMYIGASAPFVFERVARGMEPFPRRGSSETRSS